MAYVLVQVEPHTLAAAEPDYLQEAQQEADATVQTIVQNSIKEQEAQQQADAAFLENAPKVAAPKIKSAWPWVAAGAGILLLISLSSK